MLRGVVVRLDGEDVVEREAPACSAGRDRTQGGPNETKRVAESPEYVENLIGVVGGGVAWAHRKSW